MAANTPINAKNVDWNQVMTEVPVTGTKKSGIVSEIHKALAAILADGKPREVRTLQMWIEAGLNQDIVNDEDKVVVHWATVKHALSTGPYVQVEHNVFTNGGTIKPRGRKGRK